MMDQPKSRRIDSHLRKRYSLVNTTRYILSISLLQVDSRWRLVTPTLVSWLPGDLGIGRIRRKNFQIFSIQIYTLELEVIKWRDRARALIGSAISQPARSGLGIQPSMHHCRLAWLYSANMHGLVLPTCLHPSDILTRQTYTIL
jgi:hypothetical protein